MDIPSPSSDSPSLFELLGKFALAMVALVVASLWGGYILAILWRWFVVPLPFGLAPLSTNAAIGVSFISSYLGRGSIKWNEEAAWGKIFGMAAFMPAWFLFCGWVLHSVFPVTS